MIYVYMCVYTDLYMNIEEGFLHGSTPKHPFSWHFHYKPFVYNTYIYIYIYIDISHFFKHVKWNIPAVVVLSYGPFGVSELLVNGISHF